MSEGSNGIPEAWSEPPLDSEELCARLRFSLDEPVRVPKDVQEAYQDFARDERQKFRGAGVRVTPHLMPKFIKMAEQVAERLLLKSLPEIYIRGSCSPNACVILHDETPVVLVTGGLLELLSLDEVACVLGHEFGHSILRHHRNRPDEGIQTAIALDRCRAQEISADRVGLMAVGDLEIAIRTEIKVATGLRSDQFQLDIAAVIADAEAAMEGEEERGWAAASTHPEFPLRAWALCQFAQSDLYRSLTNGVGGRPLALIEAAITDRFHAIGGGTAFRVTSDIVHEVVAWLGVLIVADDHVVTETERDVLVGLVGTIWADDAVTYSRRNGMEAVKRRAIEHLETLAHASLTTQARVETAVRAFAERTGATERCGEVLKLARDTMRRA